MYPTPHALPLSSTHIEPFSIESSSSVKNEEMTGAGVEGDETLPAMPVNSNYNSSLAISGAEIDQVNHQTNTFNPKLSEVEESQAPSNHHQVGSKSL